MFYHSTWTGVSVENALDFLHSLKDSIAFEVKTAFPTGAMRVSGQTI